MRAVRSRSSRGIGARVALSVDLDVPEVRVSRSVSTVRVVSV